MNRTLKPEEVAKVINRAKKNKEVLVSINDDHQDVFKDERVIEAITHALEREARFMVLTGPSVKDMNIEQYPGLKLLKPYLYIGRSSPIVSFIVVDKKDIVIEDRV